MNSRQQPQLTSLSSITFQTRNMLQLKNKSLQPQVLRISMHQALTIRVSHNNSFGYSQIDTSNKKFIFAIQQLDEQSCPLQQGEEYEFEGRVFSKLGEFKIVCINMPKVEARIIVEKNNSQSADELFDNIPDMALSQGDLFIKTAEKLPQVKEEQPQEENAKQTKQQTIGLSNSKSDLQQYQRILTEQHIDCQDTLENKYLKYFKEEFKLWRNFFEEQQLNEKKLSLKSKHTKNLSLSEVKQLDPKHKSEYDSDKDSNHNSSSRGNGISIASQLYSHQEILDRNHDEDIHSGRKEMKKTNSEYRFNVVRSEEEEKEPTLDKISVFGKEEEEINLPSLIHHSRHSNHESSKVITSTTEKKKSRISITRTETNSPALREYKKENNFMTWAVDWAKDKDYKQVKVVKKNDQHLMKQFDTYMKNKFKVSEFLYC